MSDPVDRPLLFLDIDGPLLPFGEAVDRYPGPTGTDNPLFARLDPELGRRLSALPCDLVWATTWMEEANREVAPLLGVSALPVLDRPDPTADGPLDMWFGLHWKTRALVHFAAGRPLIWVDDEIGVRDSEWVTANHPGRALLHRVDARVGWRPADIDYFAEWLRNTGT